MAAPVEIVAQAPLIGTFASMFLLGVLCMQTFFYVQHYPKDRLFLRVAVAAVWCLEAAQTALTAQAVECYLIGNYNNPEALAYTRSCKSLSIAPMFSFVAAYICNILFIWRIYILSDRKWVAAFLAALSTVRIVLGVRNSALSIVYKSWTTYREGAFTTVIAGWTVSVVLDCAIAGALCYYLHTQRTGLRRTDTLINQLLLYSVNTGLITSIFAILVIVTFTTIQATAFIAFLQVQGKFYGISLLATLNNRHAMIAAPPSAIATFDNFKSAPGDTHQLSLVSASDSSTLRPMTTESKSGVAYGGGLSVAETEEEPVIHASTTFSAV